MNNIEKINKKELVEEYQAGMALHKICEKYHMGKQNVYKVLEEFGIERRKPGEANIKHKDFVVSDYKIKKYQPVDGYHYVAVYMEDGTRFLDIENRGGFLTSYIEKKTGEKTPPLYARNLYYMKTGNYWWEQWFDVILEKDVEVKKCPYCDWSTVDLNNRSGMFAHHLKTSHNMSKIDYLKEHPEDREYFSMANKTKEMQALETDESKFVICPICGNKYKHISTRHLATHGLTYTEFLMQYKNSNILSDDYKEFLSEKMKEVNITMMDKIDGHYFTSKSEREIHDFIENDLGIKVKKDRSILEGREIDIYIPDKKIGIEYNGLLWHTEGFAHKDKLFHLLKTEDANKKGVELIQIFEDEYALHKDIVLSKISHLLGCDTGKEKIGGRKCTIKQITKTQGYKFLTDFHIQGDATSTVYYGAFFNDKLIAVMSFLQESEGMWNLTRFATDYNYICQGVGGKIFSQFVKDYNPIEVKSFADRRWTINRDNNLYTKLGFKLDFILPPDYRYYNCKIDKYDRIHKFSFRKKVLSRKYGFSMDMTESEMAKELGYDRIWDCGLYKYVWKRGNGDQ